MTHNMHEYDNHVAGLRVYRGAGTFLGLVHGLAGLAEEAGEANGKLKRLVRDRAQEWPLSDEDAQAILTELGDTLWYISDVAQTLGSSLSEVAVMNLTKLHDRQSRNKLHGEGDKR